MTATFASTLRGEYYDGHSSAARAVSVSLDHAGLLHFDPGLRPPTPLAWAAISSQIGTTPRSITFADGALIETTDHRIVDHWLTQHRPGAGWIHQFETRASFVVAAVALLALFVIASITWGIPWASKFAANQLPAEITHHIGDAAVESMDKLVLQPSLLDAARREEITLRFQTLLPPTGSEVTYNLEFRQGGMIGANAFAFPNGTVIMTDELVELTEIDDELASILLHEIGHLEHRHSLRQIISHSSLAILTTILTGDMSAAGALVVTAPNVIMEASYSRGLETEADTFALAQMQRLGIATQHFASIMERLELAMTKSPGKCPATERDNDENLSCVEDETDGTEEANWLGFFSSHPLTKERIARFGGPSAAPN